MTFNDKNWLVRLSPALVFCKRGLRRKLLVCAVFVIANSSLYAQVQIDSLWALFLNEKALAWQLSGNAALLQGAGLSKFTKLGIAAAVEEGDFKRPQEERQSSIIQFGGEGYSKVDNWHFFANFRYGKKFKNALKFANVTYPYDGNPFITGDSAGGDWRGDQLQATMQIALPKKGRIAPAIAISYLTEQNSRQNDPKPLNRFLKYHIEPSLSYALAPKHKLLILGSYGIQKESIETGYFADRNPPIYSIRGYGEYSVGPVVTAQRFTEGDFFQFGADYLKEGRTEFLIGTRYFARQLTVEEGQAKPIPIGAYDESGIKFHLSYRNSAIGKGQFAYLKFWSTKGLGFDPVFNAINPSYRKLGIDSRIGFWQDLHQTWRGQIALLPNWEYLNYAEEIAKANWSSFMMQPGLAIALNGKLNAKLQLLTALKFSYHFNLQKEISINRPSKLSPILVSPYYEYASNDLTETALNIKAVRAVGAYQVEIAADFSLRSSSTMGSRNFNYISINLIF